MANTAEERDRAIRSEETNQLYLDIMQRNQDETPISISTAERDPHVALEERNQDETPISISTAERDPHVALEERDQDQEPNSMFIFRYPRETHSDNEDEVEDEDLNSISLPARGSKEFYILGEKIRRRFEEFKNLLSKFLKKGKECIKQLRSIAAELDKFHKGSTIANLTGSSIGIAGGIATIVGLCLAPVTFGASLIVTGVGIVVATVGGVTGAAASIADRVNIKAKCNTVQEIIQEIENKRVNMQATLTQIDTLIDEMTDLLGTNTDIVRVGARGAYTAVEIARLAQLVNLSATASRGAQIAARGAQAAAAVSGIFAVLFIVVDTAFVIKAAIELKKGAKSEEAAKIRDIADQLEVDCEQMQLVEHDFALKKAGILF